MFHQNSKLSCLGLPKAELSGLVLGIMTFGCLHRAPPKEWVSVAMCVEAARDQTPEPHRRCGIAGCTLQTVELGVTSRPCPVPLAAGMFVTFRGSSCSWQALRPHSPRTPVRVQCEVLALSCAAVWLLCPRQRLGSALQTGVGDTVHPTGIQAPPAHPPPSPSAPLPSPQGARLAQRPLCSHA